MKCPKCGADIKRFDLGVSCKQCGVNLYVYSQEHELEHDAKVTELDFAAARKFIAGLKAAFIGGKLQIARIVITVLCLVVFLLPFAEASAVFPWFSANASYSLIGCYKIYTDGIYKLVLSAVNVDGLSSGATQALVFAAMFVICVLIALFIFLFELLSFMGITRMAKVLAGFSAAGILTSAACTVTAFILGNGQNAIVSFTPQAGGFAAVIVFGAMLAVNILIAKKNIVPFVKEVDEKRIELRKKIKAGELNIDELPLPIFETPEELEARLNAIGSSASKKEKKRGGKDNG